MNLLCKSIFALLAFYIVFSECIELPQIVKKNKNLVYLLIGGFYLYSYQNDKIEGAGFGRGSKPWTVPLLVIWVFVTQLIFNNCRLPLQNDTRRPDCTAKHYIVFLLWSALIVLLVIWAWS